MKLVPAGARFSIRCLKCGQRSSIDVNDQQVDPNDSSKFQMIARCLNLSCLNVMMVSGKIVDGKIIIP